MVMAKLGSDDRKEREERKREERQREKEIQKIQPTDDDTDDGGSELPTEDSGAEISGNKPVRGRIP